MSIAILLPTYCEAGNIENLIWDIQELDLDVSIAVIDDSSPDGTAEIVRKLQKEHSNIFLLKRPKKLGLGTAITAGFRSLLSLKHPPEYIVTMDADYSHNPQDIPRLVQITKSGYDLVIGSRYCRGGKIIGWSSIRWLISRIANFIVSTITRMKIHDCTSGLRCYSRDYVKTVLPDLHSQTYEIQIETIKQARLLGFRLKEIPITFMNRKQGKSKLTGVEVRAFLAYVIGALLGRTNVAFDRLLGKTRTEI